MHSKVYTTDAWSVIKAAIRQAPPSNTRKTAAAFAAQAEEFYRAAASATAPHGRPLLLYYAFLNLAKALCLHRGNLKVTGVALHGLHDKNNHAVAIEDAIVEGKPSGTNSSQVFHEFMKTALDLGLVANTSYQIRDVLAASLVGHRLWTDAAEASDRFLKVDIEFFHGNKSKTLWMRVKIPRSSLTRHAITHAQVTAYGLGPGWRAVSTRSGSEAGIATWEQSNPITYGGRPSDKLDDLVATARTTFYRSLTTSEPFRHYYVYVPPPGYQKHHQLASRYILLFFLGSVTRYHPADFAGYLRGQFGPFLAEFLASEPGQMLFEMACLFLRREVVTVGLA